jgi:hypothetical protein
MKVELSRYSINYELNLTYVTWAKTTNIYESSEIFYGNQNENYSETKYYNNDSIRLNDDVSITASPSNLGLNIKIDWGNGLKNIPNPYNIDILNLYFNPEWYPNVIPGADPKI